jgi:hypothetical protein
MRSDRIQGRSNIAIFVAAALLAIAPASTVRAADGDDFARMGAMSDAMAQPLQLGVGQSVIRDLPEEAGEIYVGDPTVANAIVRTAKRIYISGVANGHTSIFALAKDGRRILGRSGRWRVDGAPQCRDPGQRHSRAHRREHDHSHRISGLGGGGAKGARHRFRLRQRFANHTPRLFDLHFE